MATSIGVRSFLRLTGAAKLFPARPGGISPLYRWKSISSAWCARQQRQQQLITPVHKISWLRPLSLLQQKRPAALQSRTYADDSSMSVSELESRVINVLKMFDKIDPDKVAIESRFVEDLGLDSLDVVEIVMAFEDEFGIEIDDEQAEKIFTAKDAVEFIKNNL